MDVIIKDEFLKYKRKFLKKMKDSLFIYPTDSIYGLGCDATNFELVDNLRKLKKSNLQPLSVIAPNKDWVINNCVVGEKEKKYFDALGSKLNINGEFHSFTMILKLKNKDAVASNVLQGADSIGIRIPSNWFSEIISEFDAPIVTTSANCVGENFMTSTDDLNDVIKKGVDFLVYEGEKKGVPSTIINLTKPEISVQARTLSKN